MIRTNFVPGLRLKDTGTNSNVPRTNVAMSSRTGGQGHWMKPRNNGKEKSNKKKNDCGSALLLWRKKGRLWKRSERWKKNRSENGDG